MSEKFVVVGNIPTSGKLVFADTRGNLSAGTPKVFRSIEFARRWITKRRAQGNAKVFRALNVRVARALTKNPSGFANSSYVRELDEAADRFENFTGFKATKETRFKQPTIRSGFALGTLVAVEYDQNREGDGPSRYRHEFKKKSRPLLIASSDGTLLGIVGGQYSVTSRGIEDN